MSSKALGRRVMKIERRLVVSAATCAVCGAGTATGPTGLRFVIAPDEPAALAPCARCGRVAEPLTFVIVKAETPVMA